MRSDAQLLDWAEQHLDMLSIKRPESADHRPPRVTVDFSFSSSGAAGMADGKTLREALDDAVQQDDQAVGVDDWT